MRIQGERDRDSHVFVLDRDGAGLGGVVARFVGNRIRIRANGHIFKGVTAALGGRLHLAVPGEDGVCRLHVENDGICGIGVKILPIENGVTAVDGLGKVGPEAAAEGGGKGLQIVGGFGGEVGRVQIAATVRICVIEIAVIKGVLRCAAIERIVNISKGICLTGRASHIAGSVAVCVGVGVAGAAVQVADETTSVVLGIHIAGEVTVFGGDGISVTRTTDQTTGSRG